jgi:hypothetical protein
MNCSRLQPQRLAQAAAALRGIRVQVVEVTAERGQSELKLGELQVLDSGGSVGKTSET